MIPKTPEKYQNIIRSAAKAFAEEGYFSTPVSRIAQIAGIAQGTVFKYFESKEKLLVTIFTEELARRTQILQGCLNQCQNSEERLFCIIDRFFTDMENDLDKTFVMLYEVRQPNKNIREQIVGALSDHYHVVEDVIVRGIEAGEIEPMDARTARRLIMGTLEVTAYDWLFSKRISGNEELRRETFNLIKKALLKN